MPPRLKADARLDIHNSNIDAAAAETDLCGTVDLRTGRVCRRPALHQDGCQFQPPAATPG